MASVILGFKGSLLRQLQSTNPNIRIVGGHNTRVSKSKDGHTVTRTYHPPQEHNHVGHRRPVQHVRHQQVVGGGRPHNHDFAIQMLHTYRR